MLIRIAPTNPPRCQEGTRLTPVAGVVGEASVSDAARTRGPSRSLSIGTGELAQPSSCVCVTPTIGAILLPSRSWLSVRSLACGFDRWRGTRSQPSARLGLLGGSVAAGRDGDEGSRG